MAERPAPAPATAEQDDWDRHWDEFAAASERNPAVAYRARLLRRFVAADGGPRRLLDIGVGSGDFLELAASSWPGAELAGVDVSEAGVRMAGHRVPGARVAVADLTTPGTAPAELEGWATEAVCSEVLEHIDDPVELLRNSAAMLAPGCRVVVTVPSGKMSAFDHHIGHRRHYTPALLDEQLRAAGYDVDAVYRAGFPFFNLYRAVIRARGEALIADVGAESAEPSATAKAAMAAFDGLFRLNLTRSPWGLQLLAVARPRG